MTDEVEDGTDAASVYAAVTEMIAEGQGNAILLDNEGVTEFNGLLHRNGWAPAKVGKGVDWTKDGWSLFLRSQGEHGKTIVQWDRK